MKEMLKKPEIPEMCPDEIRDFVLELIRRELQNLPPEELSRRKELCEAILAVNRESGHRARLRDAAGALVKNWQAQQEQIDGLERLGFSITKGRKHYKMRWNESGYFKTLSTSPSDFRSGANGLSELVAKFF